VGVSDETVKKNWGEYRVTEGLRGESLGRGENKTKAKTKGNMRNGRKCEGVRGEGVSRADGARERVFVVLSVVGGGWGGWGAGWGGKPKNLLEKRRKTGAMRNLIKEVFNDADRGYGG